MRMEGKTTLTPPTQNPIGSIDKADLKRFIAWAEKNFDLPCLHEFLTAVPTAELVGDRLSLILGF